MNVIIEAKNSGKTRRQTRQNAEHVSICQTNQWK